MEITASVFNSTALNPPDPHSLLQTKLMGLVRAAFPNDRAKQDLVFPVIDDGDGRVGEEGESSEG